MLQFFVLVLLALYVGHEQLVNLLSNAFKGLLQFSERFVFLPGSVDEYLVGTVLVGCAVLAVDELHNGVILVLVGGGAIGEVARAALQTHGLVD